MSTGFENSQPVPTTDFEYPAEPVDLAEDDERRIRRETVMRFLQFITNGSGHKTGPRAEVYAHLLRAGPCQTQRALAKRLEISPSALSRKLQRARKEIVHFDGP